jgi:RNA polymerase sigma-70 factor (ECF subfamily)
METSELDNLIYTASKSLRPSALKFTRNADEANDLIQDTILKALRSKAGFKTGTNIKAWLFIIMKNTFISKYHKEKRNTYIDPIENGYELITPSTIDFNQGSTNLNMEEINKAISNLNHTFREPFLLHFSGYKYEEIAKMLEIPMGTVKNRIHVARKTLMGNLKSFSV